MVLRVYLMPREPIAFKGFPGTPKHAIYAQAVHDAGGSFVRSAWWPGYVLTRIEGPQALHDALAAAPRCRQIPANMEGQIGTALPTVIATLEAVNMPTDWATATTTWGQLCLGIERIARVMQGLWGEKLRDLFDGRDLNTTWTQLPAQVRQKLRDIADKRGWDRTQVSATTTLRQMLVILAGSIALRGSVADG